MLSILVQGGYMKQITPQHILSVDQFCKDDIEELFDLASNISKWFEDKPKYCSSSTSESYNLDGNPGYDLSGASFDFLMATVFFEPSTRTRLSFEAACLKLGGDIISVENAVISSSDKKGESLEDTIKTISQYADVIVLRHPETGSAQRAAENSDVPVINAGDGDGEHPTQALLDLYTIWKEKGTIDGLNILFHADIEHARTVNSLKKLLGLYDVEIKEEGLFDSGVSPQWEEADVVYVTRIQSERHSLRMNDAITQVNKNLMGKMKNDAILLHPLPRCGEVSRDVDSDHRSAFWRQVKNGMYVRMALLKMVLGHI